MNTLNEHRVIIPYNLRDNGVFPNNDKLPLLLYKDVLILAPGAGDKPVINLFNDHGWSNEWTDGIFDYHHYHSITHEVLGIISGRASVIMGGENGVILEIQKGDVMVIPAGVAHKRIQASADFKCVGAYPGGKDYDIKTGKQGERPEADENIRKVPIPSTDPVYGSGGPLLKYWKNTTAANQ